MLRFSLLIFGSLLSAGVLAEEWTPYTVNADDQLGFLVQKQGLEKPIWGRSGLLKDVLIRNPQITNPHKIRPGEVVYLPLVLKPVETQVEVATPAEEDSVSEVVQKPFLFPLLAGAYFSLWDRDVTDKKTGARATLESNLISGVWLGSGFSLNEEWSFESLFTLKKISFAGAQDKEITETRTIYFGLDAGVLKKGNSFQYGFGMSYDELPYVSKYDQNGISLSTSRLLSPYLKGQWMFNESFAVGMKLKYIVTPLQGFSISPYVNYQHKLLNGLSLMVNPFVTVENPESRKFRYEDREMGVRLGIQGAF